MGSRTRFDLLSAYAREQVAFEYVCDNNLRLIWQALYADCLPKADCPTLFILVGLPGCGKSTVACELALRLPAAVVQSDRVRAMLFSRRTYSAEENERVFETCYALIAELLARRVNVVYDATNIHRLFRFCAVLVAQRMGVRHVFVHLHAPPEVVHARIAQRQEKRDANQFSEGTYEVYESMAAAFEPISEPHISVDTCSDIASIVDDVLRQTAELLD